MSRRLLLARRHKHGSQQVRRGEGHGVSKQSATCTSLPLRGTLLIWEVYSRPGRVGVTATHGDKQLPSAKCWFTVDAGSLCACQTVPCQRVLATCQQWVPTRRRLLTPINLTLKVWRENKRPLNQERSGFFLIGQCFKRAQHGFEMNLAKGHNEIMPFFFWRVLLRVQLEVLCNKENKI